MKTDSVKASSERLKCEAAARDTCVVLLGRVGNIYKSVMFTYIVGAVQRR